MENNKGPNKNNQNENKNLDSQLLSEIVFYRSYAKTLNTGKKETFEETVERVENMHIKKFPQLFFEIHKVMNLVRERRIVPSMRSMQFAGKPVEIANTRMYNCSFTHVSNFRDIADILYLLCCGVGCGYSVQHRHIDKLPEIQPGHKEYYDIPDTKEGWAESIYGLLNNHDIEFGYKQIRPRGAPLSSGGTASGPETLKILHENIRSILKKASGRKLTSLEVHDIICMIGDLIVSGGSRRSALISLFDVHDKEMLECKKGWDWFDKYPHRARANNSAVINRKSPTFIEDMTSVVKQCFENGSGEPGIFLTNDLDYGTNPCGEISLRSKQMCNLTEVNVSICKTPEEFLKAVEGATILGTIQATYTDFTFVQPEWKENCEKDALLGVSLTGIAQNWSLLSSDGGKLLEKAAQLALDTNLEWSKKLGINPASRITCVKPSGTTSALLGTTSGIHAAHAEYYLRRVRIETNSPLTSYLLNLLEKVRSDNNNNNNNNPPIKIDAVKTPVAVVAKLADQCEKKLGLPLLETDVYSRQKIEQQQKEVEERKKKGEKEEEADQSTSVPASLVVTMPINMTGAIVRGKETAIELLERSAFIHKHFIQKAHREGPNYHNVSLTVNYLQRETKKEKDEKTGEEKEVVVQEGEEEAILEWLKNNYNCFSGIALFPDCTASLSKYPQLPFEEVDKETYQKWRDCWNRLGRIIERENRKERKMNNKNSSSSSSSSFSSSSSIKQSTKSNTTSSSETSSHESEHESESNSTESENDSEIENTSLSNSSDIDDYSSIDESEDPLSVLVKGMSDVEWDPNAVDKRKEILACAGGNCEYV